MKDCSFQMLGSLIIAFDGKECTARFSSGKARLLAYLALAWDMPQSRKRIACDFWPDSTEKQALSNLRKLLHDLRESLPQIERYLEITSTHMQWNREVSVYSDVHEFERAAQGQTLHELRRAESLYKGELLPGFYDEWLETKREQLAQMYLSVLDRLVSVSESRRDFASAMSYANKLLAHDKLMEETYRTLMRLHACNNNQPGVMQIYRQLCDVLKSELGIGPAEETSRLMKRLMQNVGGVLFADARSHEPLVGRIAEWGIMLNAWKQAAVDGSVLCMLKGEAGIGKTRLALEMIAWVQSSGGQTAFAGCYQSTASLSYIPVTAWLKKLPVPKLSPVWLSELSRLLPELAERYPDLPKPSPIKENWQLNRWYEAIERMLLAKQPLLLILDDIQWSDGETLQLLSWLLRGGSKARLLVIATMRTDEYPSDAVEHFVARLRLERKLTEVELAPLDEEETKRLAAAAAGDELAARRASCLYAETGGNPLFIVETLRQWQTGGKEGDFRLSPLAKTVIENRLIRLSSDHRRLASMIAAIGRTVSPELVAKVAKTEAEATLEQIEQLAKLNVLRDAGNGEYDFTHDLIRNAAYQLINESRRRGCHRKIASGLLAFHRGEPEAAAAEIALHYELAGMNKEAVVYYEMAASAAEKLYANETLIQYYRKLCELMPPEQIMSILLKLGDALIITGNWNEAEGIYRQWLERFAHSATIRERSLCDAALGNNLRLQGKYEDADFHLERARRHFEMLEDHSGLSLVYGMLGTLHYYTGGYDKALHYLMRRNELPCAGSRTREDCRFLGIIGHVYYDQCDYGQAIHWIGKQIALAEKNRDRYSVEQAMGILAMVNMDIDEMDLAFELLVDKMEISKSIGDRMGFAIAMGMLGKYYWYLGHYQYAAPCIAFCLEEAVAIHDWRIVAIMLSYEGRNLLAQQRLEEADRLLERSIRLFKQLRSPYFACETFYYTSLLRQRQNRHISAVEAAEEALETANRLKRRDMRVNLTVQLLRLNTDLGRMTPAEALNQLERMRESCCVQQDQALIRYALWKLDPESSERRTAALSLNAELYQKSGKKAYLIRCGEMGWPMQDGPERPMQPLADEVTKHKIISSHILEKIDQFMNR